MDPEPISEDVLIDVNGPQDDNQMKIDERKRSFRGRSRFKGMKNVENEQAPEDQNHRGRFNVRGSGGRGSRGGRFRGSRSGGPGGDPSQSRISDVEFFNLRLQKMVGTSTVDLSPQEYVEKKFNARCRLYVGNIPPNITEEEFKEIFATYGETSEIFINKEKNFGFIRLDYQSSSEKAKRELDGHSVNNRNIRVRFAPLGSTVKVKNLSQYVTSELLEKTFSVFGEVERTIVNVDERGNSLKEGIVEFARKSCALTALRLCSEGCLFLTASLKPVVLEPFEISEDNFSEKSITKKGPDFFEARESIPRFAKPGSFEFEFGTRWKQMHELYRQKEEALKKEMKLEEEKLEAQLQYAKYEHETELLREQLRQKEMDRERQKREWEMKQRQADEQRLVEEEGLRRQQDELSRRMLHQEDELRRRQQENSLFMQGQQLSNLIESPPPALPFTSTPEGVRDFDTAKTYQYEGQRTVAGETNYMDMSYNRNRYEASASGLTEMEDMASRRPSAAGGRWAHQERRGQNEEFPTKRRRY